MSGPATFLERLTAADYLGLLFRLGLRGRAFSPDDPGLRGTLEAGAEELARVEGRLLDVLEEADVETTTELLPGWEEVFNLPDPCDPSPPSTTADRRTALHARLVARLGAQPALVRIAVEALGYSNFKIEIGTMFRADESASDERAYDYDWAVVWFLWAATTPAQGWDRVLCVFRDGRTPISPAHSRLVTIDGLHANEVATPT